MDSVNMLDLAQHMSDNIDIVGPRPGEKTNEDLEKVIIDENSADNGSEPIKVFKTPKKKCANREKEYIFKGMSI